MRQLSRPRPTISGGPWSPIPGHEVTDVTPLCPGTLVSVALFLRAFEHPDGWECRQGNRVWDSHPTLEEAVDHLRELARAMEGPVLLIAHRLGGPIEHLEEVGS